MLLVSVGLVSLGSLPCSAQTDGKTNEVDFAKQIQPILAKRCFACHGPDEAEGGLRFTSQKEAFVEADSGEHAIVPGDSQASALLARVTSDVEDEQMPPEGKRLSPEEVDLLKRWIEQGAKWQQHWAFKPMQNP
jgi:mono/diheme cytochrome c family protein